MTHIYKSTFPNLEIPDKTLTDFVFTEIRKYGKQIAFVIYGSSYTYEQLLGDIQTVCRITY